MAKQRLSKQINAIYFFNSSISKICMKYWKQRYIVLSHLVYSIWLALNQQQTTCVVCCQILSIDGASVVRLLLLFVFLQFLNEITFNMVELLLKRLLITMFTIISVKFIDYIFWTGWSIDYLKTDVKIVITKYPDLPMKYVSGFFFVIVGLFLLTYAIPKVK